MWISMATEGKLPRLSRAHRLQAALQIATPVKATRHNQAQAEAAAQAHTAACIPRISLFRRNHYPRQWSKHRRSLQDQPWSVSQERSRGSEAEPTSKTYRRADQPPQHLRLMS